MSKYHQVEVLRILHNNGSVHKNENNNGTFINLTEQSSATISSLEVYADYVDRQHQEIDKIENEKKNIDKHFFNNGYIASE
jgi:hypothetical protein